MVVNLMPRLWRRPFSPGNAVDVASAEELFRHRRLVVTPPDLGTAILVVLTRRGVFAVENRCPHRGARLDDAGIRGRTVTCPMHGRRYDLRSGRCSSGAIAAPLRTFPARIVAGRVLVGPFSSPA
jgi:nitrite reductase [NAD(P)H] small subunit